MSCLIGGLWLYGAGDWVYGLGFAGLQLNFGSRAFGFGGFAVQVFGSLGLIDSVRPVSAL